MDRLTLSLLALLVLGGCAAFIPSEPLDLGSQLWRDAKGIKH